MSRPPLFPNEASPEPRRSLDLTEAERDLLHQHRRGEHMSDPHVAGCPSCDKPRKEPNR